MALDSKLRLQIATVLDNAGIKATEQQIDGLAAKLDKINKDAQGKQLENAIGGLDGKIGKIAKTLGGIPGTIGLIVGALELGYTIGTKFFDVVVRGWFGWEDAVTKLKKANKSLMKELQHNARVWEQQIQSSVTLQGRQIQMTEQAIKRLNDEAAAYTRLSKAKTDFANAGEDIEIQRLERERFEDMIALQANGEYDRAEQVSKIYDIYRQEIEAKKQIASYDEETLRLEQQQAAKEEEISKWMEKVANLRGQQAHWKAELDKLYSDDGPRLLAKDWDNLEKKILGNISNVEKQLEAAETQAGKYISDIDTGNVEMLARERNRATLADKLNLDKDKLLWQQQSDVLSKLRKQEADLYKAYDNLYDDNFVNKTSSEEWNAERDMILEDLEAIQNQISLATKQAMVFSAAPNDNSMWRYEQDIKASGMAFGGGFTMDYIKQARESTVQSYTELHDIKQNTEDLAEKLDQLLQMK